MTMTNILSMIAGVTLLLFGMDTMGNGLEKLAGGKMQKILRKLTANPINGFLLGMIVTAVIQSSGATTVLVVGFVNSGIMTLQQAVGVIMGANVGTTATAWLLSLTNVGGAGVLATIFNPSFFGPILGLVGVAMRMWSKRESQQYSGSILLGFAVLMSGMGMISSSVSPLAGDPNFVKLFTLFSNPILGMIAGALLTAILQSSSASIGVLQALSVTGAVTLSSAIPILLGQNIGSCVTALLASIGANKNARRAALIHLYFNLFGAIVVMIIFLPVKAFIQPAFLNNPINAVDIAVFHTAYNLFATAILMPLRGQLLKAVMSTVRDDGRKSEKVCMLDERLFSTPAAAVAQSRENVVKMAEEAHASLLTAIAMTHSYNESAAETVTRQENDIDHYEDALGTYLVHLSSLDLTGPESRDVSGMLHVIGDFERLSDHAVNIAETAREMRDKEITFSPAAWRELDVLTGAINEILDLAIRSYIARDVAMAAQVEPLEEVIDDLTREIRTRHIARLRSGECTIELGFILTDLLGNYERVSDHCSNIAVALIELAKDSFETHEYLNYLKDTGAQHFRERYDAYRAKYALE